jgi:hypothetical protein
MEPNHVDLIDSAYDRLELSVLSLSQHLSIGAFGRVQTEIQSILELEETLFPARTDPPVASAIPWLEGLKEEIADGSILEAIASLRALREHVQSLRAKFRRDRAIFPNH